MRVNAPKHLLLRRRYLTLLIALLLLFALYLVH